MASTCDTKCKFVIIMCVLHIVTFVALLIFINKHYCSNIDSEQCKMKDESDEEYENRNVTSAETKECSGTNKLQFLVITVRGLYDKFAIRTKETELPSETAIVLIRMSSHMINFTDSNA